MKMKKSTVLWSVIGVLFIVAMFMMFNAGASGSVVSSATQAAQVAAPAPQAAYGGMVGGC